MTASDVLFDTWAWWEVLHGSPRGRRLWKKYEGLIHTSVLTLSELGSKLGRMGQGARIPAVLEHVSSESTLHPVTADDARNAGPLHAELRKSHDDVGLMDALILASARERRMKLISNDHSLHGLADVQAT